MKYFFSKFLFLLVLMHEISAQVLLQGSHVGGLAGLTVINNDYLCICSPDRASAFLFNLNTNEFNFKDPVMHVFTGSYLDDVDKIGNNALVFSSFLDGAIWRINTNCVETQLNGETPASCGPCGASNLIYYPTLLGNNPVAYNAVTQKVYTQTFDPTKLYVIDPQTPTAPVALNLNIPTALNAFDFAPNGLLYAPAPSANKVVSVDITTGVVTNIITNIDFPIAVKSDNQNHIYIIGRRTGLVYKYNIVTQALVQLAQLQGPLDNCVVHNGRGKLYVTNAQATLYAVDIATGFVEILFEATIAAPYDLAFTDNKLFLADTSSLKIINPLSGAIEQQITASVTNSPFNAQVQGIFVDSEVYVVTESTQGLITVVNRNDLSIRATFTLMGKQPFSSVRVVDNSGEYYLTTNAVDGTLVKFEIGQAPVIFANGLRAPVKLRLVNNLLYIAEAGDLVQGTQNSGRLGRIDLSNLTYTIIFDRLNKPQGFDIVPINQNLSTAVIAEVGNDRIIEVNATNPGQDYRVLYDNLGFTKFALTSAFNPVPMGRTIGLTVNASGNKLFVTENRNRNKILKLSRSCHLPTLTN